MPDGFASASGKNVKIAIIDDGIWPGLFSDSNLIGGARIQFDENEGLLIDDNWASTYECSHGTSCAAVISHRVPNAKLYSLKILSSRDGGHPLALAEALKWAGNHEINILNISLGMTGQRHVNELHKEFVAAVKAGIIIISATHVRGLKSYPSAFPEVIGVGKDDRYEEYQYGYYPGRLAEFVASSQVPSFAPNSCVEQHIVSKTYGGTSIAAARMTANTAALLEILPKSDLAQVKDELAARQTKLTSNISMPSRMFEHQAEQMGSSTNSEPLRMKNVAIYPYDRTTEPLLRYKDQFKFQIDCVIDPVHISMSGKDAGSLFGLGELDIRVIPDLNGLKPETETLIIGDLEDLKKGERKDFLYIALDYAVKNNKNVSSLAPVEPHIYRVLCDQAQQKHLSFVSAHDATREILTGDLHARTPDVDAPVIGVLGTSFNQAKFATQLALRRALREKGYEVAVVGTNPICALLDNGVYVTQDRRSHQAVETTNQTVCWEMAITKACERRPQVIIVGSQGGVVPPRLYKTSAKEILFGLKDFPPEYTLPSLTVLMASKPDAVVLVINSIDHEQHIRRTISVIENLSSARVIALTLADKLVCENAYGYSQRWGRSILAAELECLESKFSNLFRLPVYCPFLLEQQNRLADVVVESFAID
ncbi:MAG: S8 family serine peptidase [Limisphaerales bacterium]